LSARQEGSPVPVQAKEKDVGATPEDKAEQVAFAEKAAEAKADDNCSCFT
jgi:hypothetical protein